MGSRAKPLVARPVRQVLVGLVGCLALALVGCRGVRQATSLLNIEPVVGVKIYEATGDLDRLFAGFDDLGINALFVSEKLASEARFRMLARERGMPVFVIFPVFYDPDALKKDPGLSAVTRTGAPATDDWVSFVCPTRTEFRRRKVEALKRMLGTLQPEGVSFDFIRFFVYWEMIHPDRISASIPNTCFCPSCLASFSAETGIALPSSVKTAQQAAAWIEGTHLERWTEWKCGVISSMARDLAGAAKAARPGVLINLHAVPWRQTDYDSAIRRVAGQDFAALSRFTDYLSPMCYTLMLRRQPAWVASVVADMNAISSCPILPSIQVRTEYPGDLAISTREFEATLEAALAPPSHGVIFWSWAHLVQEPEKMRVIAGRLGPRHRR
jgi:hypothetical protein